MRFARAAPEGDTLTIADLGHSALAGDGAARCQWGR
jgi:hypothetical protein